MVDKLYYKRYYAANKEKSDARSVQYWREHRHDPHWKLRRKLWRQKHKEQLQVECNKYRCRLKTEVLTHYGNGKLACIKCGYSDIRALCLDHINPSLEGNNNRRRGGAALYSHLRKHNFPEGYQTLCANCNYIKEFEIDLKKAKYPNRTIGILT